MWASARTVATIRERVQAYADAGVHELAIGFVADDIPAAMRRYAAELIARRPELASRRQ
jgi:hypothetical protein